MSAQRYLLAIDQGTSSTKTVIFDSEGRIVAKAVESLKSYFPQPGSVEQEALENGMQRRGLALTRPPDEVEVRFKGFGGNLYEVTSSKLMS